MGRVNDWWLNRPVGGDWRLPISSVQGVRPVGGYLVGTATAIEFVPNRFEALVGGRAWRTAVDDIESFTLGWRRLRIMSAADGNQTLFTNRPAVVRRHLGVLLDRQAA